MKKLLLSFVFMSISFLSYARFKVKPAKITVEGNTLHYAGGLDQNNLKQFNVFIKYIDTSILRTFKVKSGGGWYYGGNYKSS